MQHVVIYMDIGGFMFQVVPKTCRQDSQLCVLLLAGLPPNFGDFPIGSSVRDGQKCSNINQRESKRPSAHSECFCFFPRPLVEITTVQITDGFPFSRQRGVYIVHQRVLPGLADEAAR